MSKILIITSSGIMAPQIMAFYKKAFDSLGHKTFVLDILKVEKDYRERGISVWIKKVGDIKDFNPDFALSYGYTGMIRTNDGVLLRQLGIPLALLHYDCPFFELEDDLKKEFLQNSGYYYHFIWDREFLNDFSRIKIKNLYPIMLAADEKIFSPVKKRGYSYDVSFVGSISNPEKARRERRKKNFPIINRFIDVAIEIKLKNIDFGINQICSELVEIPRFKALKNVFGTEIYYKKIYQAIHLEGSGKFRKRILSSLDPSLLTVFSSETWGKKIKFLPNTDYQGGLKVFKESKINLNITSLQLEGSINNRIFDVFASGGFLLTDFKEDLKLVLPDYEDIVYFSTNDLKEKIRFYLDNKKKREDIIERMQETILDKHTYRERAKYLLKIVNKEWKETVKTLIENV